MKPPRRSAVWRLTAVYAAAFVACALMFLAGAFHLVRVKNIERVQALVGADVEAVLWSGIFVPKETPPAIVRKLEAEFARIARLPDVVARLKALNIDPVGNSSEEFSTIIAADL